MVAKSARVRKPARQAARAGCHGRASYTRKALPDPRRYFRSEQLTHGQPQGMRRCVRDSVVVIVGRDVTSRTER
jgi:hypothetical protein